MHSYRPDQDDSLLKSALIVKRAYATIDNTKLKALSFLTAKVMVPAAGAGTINIPLLAIIKCDTSAGAYTNVNGSFLFSLDAATVSEADSTNTGNVLTSGDAETWIISTVIATSFAENASENIENKPILFYLDNSGALTGGNAANVLTVILFYATVNVSAP